MQSKQDKWRHHEDFRQLEQRLSPVPVAIIGTKFDAFANQYDTQLKKQLCMALRCIAHSNGCDLVFGSVKEKVPSQLYRALLMAHVFDLPAGGNVELNPT